MIIIQIQIKLFQKREGVTNETTTFGIRGLRRNTEIPFAFPSELQPDHCALSKNGGAHYEKSCFRIYIAMLTAP